MTPRHGRSPLESLVSPTKSRESKDSRDFRSLSICPAGKKTRRNRESCGSEDAQEPVTETLPPPSGAIPETLVLERWRNYDFGNHWHLGQYNTEWGPALFRVTGPYPGGEVRH